MNKIRENTKNNMIFNWLLQFDGFIERNVFAETSLWYNSVELPILPKFGNNIF